MTKKTIKLAVVGILLPVVCLNLWWNILWTDYYSQTWRTDLDMIVSFILMAIIIVNISRLTYNTIKSLILK